MTGQSRRHYRMAALEREGVLFGLSLAQLAIIGPTLIVILFLGAFGVWWLAIIGVPILIVTVGRVHHLPLIAYVFTFARSVVVTSSWSTNTPWNGLDGDAPKVLAGLKITNETGIGVASSAVVWHLGHEASVVMRVAGIDFATRTGEVQESMIDGWGTALSTFATSGSPVVRISVTDVANRSTLDDHLGWVERQGAGVPNARRAEYMNLVNAAGLDSIAHDVFVTLTVRGTNETEMLQRVRSAVQMMRRSLDAADLSSVEVLDRAQLGELVLRGIDPTRPPTSGARTGSLSARLRSAKNLRFGPSATWLNRKWFETDGCAHRSWHVSNWPLQALRADWLTNLLTQARVDRRVTIIFEPVPPDESHRKINRDMARLDTIVMSREDNGKRVDGGLERARQQIADREEELLNGFAEMRISGVISVSGTSAEALEDAGARMNNAALQTGLSLRALDREQDKAWAIGLGLGIPVEKSLWV